MNKRIRELALEADLITHKIPNGLAHLHTEKDLEKFAELIVRECAARATGSQNTCEEDIGAEVLKHFGLGVEE
jgi:hypothetical protein